MIVSGIDAARIDDAQPQLPRRPARPTPARLGASVPCNCRRETGRNGTTGRARPAGWRRLRGRSPGRPAVPVSGAGMASPMISYGASAGFGRGGTARQQQCGKPGERDHLPNPSAESFLGDRPEPTIRDTRLRRARIAAGASSGLTPPAPRPRRTGRSPAGTSRRPRSHNRAPTGCSRY